MWKIKDWCLNLFYSIRVWFYVLTDSKKLSNTFKENNRELTFSDEFKDGKLDRDVWRTDSYYGKRFHPENIENEGRAPDVYYADDHVCFSASKLLLKVSNESIDVNHTDWDGKDWGNFKIPYRVGQIDNSKSFKQKYGYFEIRSKTQAEPGSWPAFWLVSSDNYPPEIDVYEIYTGRKNGLKRFSSNFHWRKEKGDKSGPKQMLPKSHYVHNVASDFHIYAVEWTEKYFKVYYDNVLVRVFTNPEALSFFEYPMHIIINSAIHPDQGPLKANYPNYHEIDYVKAFK